MGIETAVGNFLFRSKFSAWLWDTSTASPFYLVRLVGAVLISLFLVARAGRLFLYTKLTGAPVLGFVVIGVVLSGPWRTAIAGLVVGLLYLFYQQIRQPADNAGHRAGGKGFQGPLPENTVEALKDLVARDNKAPIKSFHYVEFDVHETKDGELVILHDLDSFLKAAADSELNKNAIEDLRAVSSDLKGLKVDDLTLSQLKALHIGGNRGIHAPTLSEFLSACEQAGLQRTAAVEVKSIVTDAGREKFIEILSAYKRGYCARLEVRCPERKYSQLGWIAAISFPFFWSFSFGEFCTPEWARWAARFRAAGIPVRSCVLHSLDLVPPTR